MNHLVSLLLLKHKSRHFSLYDRQWTLSALQLHPWALIVVDEDATAGTPSVKR